MGLISFRVKKGIMKIFEIELGQMALFSVLIALLFVIPGSFCSAADPCALEDCSCIKDDQKRLECCNERAKREPCSKESYLSKLWELDVCKPRGRFTFIPHRSTYLLPFSHNTSANETLIQQASPGRDVLDTEVHFQLSLKVKLIQDIFGKNWDFWFGFTQRSFWQLWNFEDSSPFRETNYEPEFLLNWRINIDRFGIKLHTINFGLNHQSNGQSEPLSRSWNRIVGNIGLEKGDFTLLVKTWYRIPEKEESDDNPNIEDYMGHGEIWGYYLFNGKKDKKDEYSKAHRFGIMLRNNLKFSDNRGAIQLEWSFPLLKHVSGYIQYFNGYGESLLDYDDSTNRISVGFILPDWI